MNLAAAALGVLRDLSIFTAGFYVADVVRFLRRERARRPRPFVARHAFCCRPLELDGVARRLIQECRRGGRAAVGILALSHRPGDPGWDDLARTARNAFAEASRVVLSARGLSTKKED